VKVVEAQFKDDCNEFGFSLNVKYYDEAKSEEKAEMKLPGTGLMLMLHSVCSDCPMASQRARQK
jgi:hypothetical protein